METRMAKIWKAMNEPCVTNAEFPFSYKMFNGNIRFHTKLLVLTILSSSQFKIIKEAKSDE